MVVAGTHLPQDIHLPAATLRNEHVEELRHEVRLESGRGAGELLLELGLPVALCLGHCHLVLEKVAEYLGLEPNDYLVGALGHSAARGACLQEQEEVLVDLRQKALRLTEELNELRETHFGQRLMVLQQCLDLLHKVPLIELLHLRTFLFGRGRHLSYLRLTIRNKLHKTTVLLPFETLQELYEHYLAHLLLEDLLQGGLIRQLGIYAEDAHELVEGELNGLRHVTVALVASSRRDFLSERLGAATLVINVSDAEDNFETVPSEERLAQRVTAATLAYICDLEGTSHQDECEADDFSGELRSALVCHLMLADLLDHVHLAFDNLIKVELDGLTILVDSLSHLANLVDKALSFLEVLARADFANALRQVYGAIALDLKQHTTHFCDDDRLGHLDNA